MYWVDLRATKVESDLVDHEGRPLTTKFKQETEPDQVLDGEF
jgi:hypothetical protein